jgi:hypothetical protein
MTANVGVADLDDDGTAPSPGSVDGLEALDGLDDVAPAAPPRRPTPPVHPIMVVPPGGGWHATQVAPLINFRRGGIGEASPPSLTVDINARTYNAAFTGKIGELVDTARAEREKRFAAVRQAFLETDQYAALVKLRATRDGVTDRIAAVAAKVQELETVLPNVIRDGEDPFDTRKALDDQRREVERLRQWADDLAGEIARQQKAAAEELARRLDEEYSAMAAAAGTQRVEAFREVLEAVPPEAWVKYIVADKVFSEPAGVRGVVRRHGGI